MKYQIPSTVSPPPPPSRLRRFSPLRLLVSVMLRQPGIILRQANDKSIITTTTVSLQKKPKQTLETTGLLRSSYAPPMFYIIPSVLQIGSSVQKTLNQGLFTSAPSVFHHFKFYRIRKFKFLNELALISVFFYCLISLLFVLIFQNLGQQVTINQKDELLDISVGEGKLIIFQLNSVHV